MNALLKDIKKALLVLGQSPPYLSEMRRHEVLAWMDKYLTKKQRTAVLKQAHSLEVGRTLAADRERLKAQHARNQR